MARSLEFVAFVSECLEPLREVAAKPFFGGTALSYRDTQFAMIMDNDVYFAVDDQTRPAYVAMGSACFSYETKKGRVDVTRYYAVPADLLEDSERLIPLAREAIAASARRPRKKAR